MPENTNAQAAPTMTVNGQTLTWNAIAKVGTYVLVTKVPGTPDAYSVVSGTSITPAAVPGATVKYSVRTAVEGSAWATEVSVTYPAPPPPPPVQEAPKETPAPVGTTGFQPGINSGWVYGGQLDVPAVQILGAKFVRVEFPVEWTAKQLEPTIAGYASMGIRVAPLAAFYGTLPTPAQAQALASWATAYGPGGTFWAGRTDGALAIQTIEFGNETNGGYQYGDSAGSPSYQARAQNYALPAEGSRCGHQRRRREGRNARLLGRLDGQLDERHVLRGPEPRQLRRRMGQPPLRPRMEGQIRRDRQPGRLPRRPGEHPDRHHRVGHRDGQRPNSAKLWLQREHELPAGRRNAEVDRHPNPQLPGQQGRNVHVYQVRDQQATGASGEREAYFGALQHENQAKGAFTVAVKEMLAG